MEILTIASTYHEQLKKRNKQMGYYSTFEIQEHTNKELTKDFHTRLEDLSDYSFDRLKDGTLSSCDSYKWYECDTNMHELSLEFPELLLSVTWIGEDDERGRTYYMNGKQYSVNVTITYPEPQMDKLKGTNA
jgi:hypothetical protein